MNVLPFCHCSKPNEDYGTITYSYSQSCVPADFLNNTRAIDCFLERLLDREMANEVSWNGLFFPHSSFIHINCILLFKLFKVIELLTKFKKTSTSSASAWYIN